MKLSEHVERKHPPSYNELWMACVESENHIAQLEAENKKLRQLALDMDSRFAALTDEERDALKEGG